jgi:hypothetical protein
MDEETARPAAEDVIAADEAVATTDAGETADVATDEEVVVEAAATTLPEPIIPDAAAVADGC